ncbi:ABC transporter permease [Ramlibacter solisilvae]|uniref:Peptide ABC transporter permease n=1 Tax=Ramlibacter tataouinensis TaxID=94132 RepID=A0A127JUT2_9BURK|nr:peptide ABC transporter permease [Ramlibacter tataouinensis]
MERFRQDRIATVAAIILLAIVSVALLAPWVSPQNPYDLQQLDIMDSNLPPWSASGAGSHFYVLGTDEQGRDLLSAILYGLRISIGVGLASGAIACTIGTLLGVFSAYRGGGVDSLMMRLVDLQLGIPVVLLAVILLAILGRGVENVVIAIVAAQWARYARTARGTALVEMRKEYVDAARCLGLSGSRIVVGHVLRNCLPPVLVLATVDVAFAIALEATLSFLGIGLPITEPSLGRLIANGYQQLLAGKLWLSTYPGIALLVMVACLNIVGDRLRDVLDPRS